MPKWEEMNEMKCPYVRKSEVTQTIEKTNSDEDTGVYDKRIVNTVTTFEMADCMKEECAKWQDSKCTM